MADNGQKDPPTKDNCSSLGGEEVVTMLHTCTHHLTTHSHIHVLTTSLLTPTYMHSPPHYPLPHTCTHYLPTHSHIHALTTFLPTPTYMHSPPHYPLPHTCTHHLPTHSHIHALTTSLPTPTYMHSPPHYPLPRMWVMSTNIYISMNTVVSAHSLTFPWRRMSLHVMRM